MIEEIDLPEQNFGPGNVLRAKREEYEWSIEAVAEALHLSTRSVKAIEADRYDDLPGATYVMGYWRSYARLLGIDIEETITANKRNLNIVAPETSGIDVNRAYRRNKSGGMIPMFLLLAALAGFGYYAWQQQFFGLLDGGQMFNKAAPESSSDAGNNANVQPEPVIKETEGLQAANDATQGANSGGTTLITAQDTSMQSAPIEQVTEPVLEPIEINEAPAVATDSAPQGASLANLQSGLLPPSNQGTQANVSGNNNGDVLMNQSVPATATEAPAVLENNVEGTLASQNGDTAVLQGSGQDAGAVDNTTMTISLNKDSWLDVRDKSNKRLLYKTETAGQEIKVKGNPPFYVYIGTPNGVKIQYKGKNVPFETHRSGLFARFKLGETLESL